jgi:hypothetical protein
MNHYILTPEDHPQSHLLYKITDDLLRFINADSVYYSFDNKVTGPETIFSIFLERDSAEISNDLFALADRTFKPYPEIAYQILSCNYAEDALRKGNLFILKNCTLGKFGYGHVDAGHPFYPEEAAVSKLLRRATKHFNKGMNKVNTYLIDVPRCIEYENYLEATFIIHKAMELLFKIASNFIMGKQYVSKSIAAQQMHLNVFAPSLSNLFHIDQEDESDLLDALDSSYWNYKRKQPFKIKLPDLDKLQIKVDWLKNEVRRLFDETIAECEEKLLLKTGTVETEEVIEVGPVKNEEAEILTDDLQKVGKLITDYIQTSAIYCFGQRTIANVNNIPIVNEKESNNEQKHFYLLVITEENKNNAIADLENIIKSKTSNSCTATVLLHKVTSLRHRTGHQLYFFYQVITKGLLVYENTKYPPDFHFDKIPYRNVKASKIYWKGRHVIADTFLDSEYQIDRSDAELVKETMMHIAVEQICLGLIDVFLGYRPSHHSLNYLFDLCESFSSLTAEIFPRRTEEDIKIFNLLAAHLSAMRHAELKYANWTYTEMLEKRCSVFFEKATLLIDAELERLEQLSGNNNQNA